MYSEREVSENSFNCIEIQEIIMIEIKWWKQAKEFLYSNTFKEVLHLMVNQTSKQNAKNTRNQLKAYQPSF